MDGLPLGNSIHSSRDLAAHSHRRGYPTLPDGVAPLSMSGSMPFMMPSYQMTMPNAKPSCAAAAGASYQQAADCGRMPAYAQDSLYKSSSYGGGVLSAARRSPSRSSVPTPMSSASLSLPHARSSGSHYPSVPGTSSSNPVDLVFPQYQDPPPLPTQKSSGPPEPPKKPLSPYMRFSKSVWFQVKARNPHLSVCQLGATIGRMWRELTEEEKRRHLEDFHQDKVRYDNELKRYMKTTGLRAKDLKALAKSQPKSKNRHRTRPASSSNHASASAVPANPQFAAAQFMGLPLVSMPMGVGMPAGMLGPSAMGMLPHFSQVWTGQQYPGQPASAAMMGIAGHLAQGLYSNGYAAAAAAAEGSGVGGASSLSTAKPPMLTHDGQPLAMYRYSQNYH